MPLKVYSNTHIIESAGVQNGLISNCTLSNCKQKDISVFQKAKVSSIGWEEDYQDWKGKSIWVVNNTTVQVSR